MEAILKNYALKLKAHSSSLMEFWGKFEDFKYF